MKKVKRFSLKTHQLIIKAGVIKIIVDNQTGVNYLTMGGMGITPLLDSEGKIVIDKIK